MEQVTTNDFDEDGVPDELTVGDITAATIFQVAMNIPGRVIPDNVAARRAARRGEARFEEIGCTDCHKPALALNNRHFLASRALSTHRAICGFRMFSTRTHLS